MKTETLSERLEAKRKLKSFEERNTRREKIITGLHVLVQELSTPGNTLSAGDIAGRIESLGLRVDTDFSLRKSKTAIVKNIFEVIKRLEGMNVGVIMVSESIIDKTRKSTADRASAVIVVKPVIFGGNTHLEESSDVAAHDK